MLMVSIPTYPVSLWLPQEALSPLMLLIGFLLPAEPGLMTRGRHGSSAVEHKMLMTPCPSFLARWTSKEKTLWRKSKGEQASLFASAELSKLSEESGTDTISG